MIGNHIALSTAKLMEPDESRFANLSHEYKVKYSELLELGEKTSLQFEYKKTIEMFGSNTQKWPDIFKRKFQSIL